MKLNFRNHCEQQLRVLSIKDGNQSMLLSSLVSFFFAKLRHSQHTIEVISIVESPGADRLVYIICEIFGLQPNQPFKLFFLNFIGLSLAFFTYLTLIRILPQFLQEFIFPTKYTICTNFLDIEILKLPFLNRKTSAMVQLTIVDEIASC